MSKNGEIYTAGKNFTLPPALTALTNSTSACVQSFTILIIREDLVERVGAPFGQKLFDYIQYLNQSKSGDQNTR